MHYAHTTENIAKLCAQDASDISTLALKIAVQQDGRRLLRRTPPATVERRLQQAAFHCFLHCNL
jgi:hypothetical protein